MSISNGTNPNSETMLQIVRVNDTTLEARVIRGGRDITDERPVDKFNWTHVSGNTSADTTWNNAHAGMKQITLTADETTGGMQFACSYNETAGVYGTVQVNDSLVASHDLATADANDVFTIENGALKVTTSTTNGTDYTLANGVLSVNNGFSDTITSTATFNNEVQTKEIDFIYDHNGMRIGKIVSENGRVKITEYTLHGKLITHLTKRVVNAEGVETSKEELHFFYDAQSRPAFVEYNGIKYRYVHNLQGDIVAIVDAAGNPVVEYKYDAWGKPIGATPETGIGAINPFRYRSYMWEMEIGWYYLNKRFYDSVLNRFNNVDDIIGIGIGGTNVYAYCVNNPLSMIDPSGRRPISSMRVQDETASDRRYSMLMMRVQAEPIDITERLVNEMEKNYNYLVDFYNERVPKYGALIAYAMTNLEFANKVRTGKEWDLKVSWKLNRYQQYTFNGITISYDDVGNIHFGYVGSAIHNLDDLHIAAGLYQIKSKTSSFSFAKTCFDDPRDYNAVTYGYLLKNKEYITLFGGVVLE